MFNEKLNLFSLISMQITHSSFRKNPLTHISYSYSICHVTYLTFLKNYLSYNIKINQGLLDKKQYSLYPSLTFGKKHTVVISEYYALCLFKIPSKMFNC